MRIIYIWALLVFIPLVACTTDDDAINNDPFIGQWALKALIQNGQVYDIRTEHIPCFKNSTLTVESTTFSLHFSAPKSQTSTNCNSATEQGKWAKKDGKYYIVQNGQEAELPIVFSYNNTTLQFDYGSGASALTLVFIKQ